MKIFAIIHNYGLTRENPSIFGEGDATWYEMPDSSILRSGNPFFVPDFDTRFTGFPSVVYRIGRLGKSIAPRFAHRYVDAAGVAVAVVANDTLKSLRERGLPWTEAVSFDRSCLLGNLQPIDTFNNNGIIDLKCGETMSSYDINSLRLPVAEIISRLSRHNTLKNGDLILAGLNPDGLTLTPGISLTARTESSRTNLIDINIR